MYRGSSLSRSSMAALVSAGLLLGSGMGFAQTKPAAIPDAQIEANVLKALAGAPELADQSITSTTVYGTVTLNGTVRDEPSRDLAEHLVANTAGVQKVVDQLVVATVAAAASNDSQQVGTNPNLQSDGTMAPAQGQNQQVQGAPNQNVPQNGAPPAAVDPPPPPQAGQYPQYPQQYPQNRALWTARLPAALSAAAAVCCSKRWGCGCGSGRVCAPGPHQSRDEQQECGTGNDV